jgi:hypothetical protein
MIEQMAKTIQIFLPDGNARSAVSSNVRSISPWRPSCS